MEQKKTYDETSNKILESAIQGDWGYVLKIIYTSRGDLDLDLYDKLTAPYNNKKMSHNLLYLTLGVICNLTEEEDITLDWTIKNNLYSIISAITHLEPNVDFSPWPKNKLGETTLLHLSAQILPCYVFSSIFKLSQNINKIDLDGSNILHHAIYNQDLTVLGKLLSMNIDCTVKNSDNQTPFQLAQYLKKNRHIRLFKKLKLNCTFP